MRTYFLNHCDVSLIKQSTNSTYLKSTRIKLGHTNTGVLSGDTMHKITTPEPDPHLICIDQCLANPV